MHSGQIAVSPCSNPEMTLDEVLAAYSALGYKKFEAFTSWAQSAVDPARGPHAYLDLAARYGMCYHSLHLPPVDGARLAETLDTAVEFTRFARQLGAKVVLFKASDRATYIKAAPLYLEQIEGLGVTPVIQNHYGTPLTTLDHVREVMEGLADPRMHSLLEVGHFHSAGVSWREAYEYLGDTVALVHIKDQVGRQSVPFGAGEIDLSGLFRALDADGYEGVYVIEMEVQDRENTLRYLGEALSYVKRFCEDVP
jgi:sugar phosphate isomerase/epimerase